MTNTGKYFVGWNTKSDGTGVDRIPNDTFVMPAADVTLYAKWSDSPTYSITFNKNNVGATGSMGQQFITSGVSDTLTTCSLTVPAHTFSGWATSAGGSVVYTDGADYLMGVGNITLYAVWTINPSYTISFDANGGTGTISSQNIVSGATSNLTANSFTRSSYVFDGWATSAGGAVAYINNAEYTMGGANTTLYAVWLVNPLNSVTKKEMVSVPGGTFTQTDTSANSFSHTISAFQMAKHETTYELWHTVYTWATNNGYQFANAGREGNDGTAGAALTAAKLEPVTMVNWRDVVVWCNAYSEMSGKNPCYSYSGSTIKDSRDANATACDGVVCDWNADGYRLPTEGEWQYAASYKDGTSWTPYNYASGATADYNDATATGLVAWYSGNSGSKTHNVGDKTVNALGIYDMSGNVNEWCWDWYGTWPGNSTAYKGALSGSTRVRRGGSWNRSANDLRVGSRSPDSPYYESNGSGFRLACRQ